MVLPSGWPLTSTAWGSSMGNGGVAVVGVSQRSWVSRKVRTRCQS